MQKIDELFPFFNDLTSSQKELIESTIVYETYKKGDIVHRTDTSCKGLMAILDGELRTYILSEEGREVTLFRLHQDEVCVMSASCLMDAITFDVFIEAATDVSLATIPVHIFNKIMAENQLLELYLYKNTTEKFSDVMWTMQQILFLKIDRRVAQFLWDEMIRKDSMTLQLTHDEIAKNIGSVREVVSKVMKYMASEKVIELKRGAVVIIDKEKLRSNL